MGSQLTPLLDAIEVTYGPKNELGRQFLEIAEVARDLGVKWYLSRGFDRLVDVNRDNHETWGTLPPMFDPRCSEIFPENSVYIEGQHEGKPVVTLALRRYEWPDTSLDQEWESGRFAFRDPEHQMNADERWIAGAPMASNISGCVVLAGALWQRRDFRAKRIPVLTVALQRSISLTTWYPDFAIGLIEAGSHCRVLLPLYGYPPIQTGLRVEGGWQTIDLNLSWETPSVLARHVEAWTSSASANESRQRHGRDKAIRAAYMPR